MKIILTSIILLYCQISFSQLILNEGKYVSLDSNKINHTEGDSYLKSKKFLIKYFSSNSFLIDEANSILMRGNFPASFKIGSSYITWIITFNCELEFKNGIYRIELGEFKASQNAQGTTPEIPIENLFNSSEKSGGPIAHTYAKKNNERILQSINEQCKKFLNSFKQQLN